MALAACGGTAAPAGSGTASSVETGDTTAPTSEAVPAPSDAGSDPTTASPAGTETAAEQAGNAEALAFAGVDLDGTPVDGQSFAGGDVVLWMWAPW